MTFCEFPAGLRRLIYANNRIESFNKQVKRMLKKQIRSVAEEALEKGSSRCSSITTRGGKEEGEALEGNRCLP